MTLLGYQPQDLLNKSVYDFFHPEDQTHMKETFDQGKYFTSAIKNASFVIRVSTYLKTVSDHKRISFLWDYQ